MSQKKSSDFFEVLVVKWAKNAKNFFLIFHPSPPHEKFLATGLFDTNLQFIVLGELKAERLRYGNNLQVM